MKYPLSTTRLCFRHGGPLWFYTLSARLWFLCGAESRVVHRRLDSGSLWGHVVASRGSRNVRVRLPIRGSDANEEGLVEVIVVASPRDLETLNKFMLVCLRKAHALHKKANKRTFVRCTIAFSLSVFPAQL